MAVDLIDNTLVLATHNKGKVAEISDLLVPYDLKILSAAALDLDEPEETGGTFSENAALKARAAAQSSGFFALSDDSGLCVDALGGEPGVYSARWAGPDKDFGQAMALVHDKMGDTENKKAHFMCVLSLSDPQGATTEFEGRIDGHIVWPPRGEQGFGYDPVFVPEGYTQTFGEMNPAEKKKISHRACAFERFIEHCFL